jgi:hypothetical protein
VFFYDIFPKHREGNHFKEADGSALISNKNENMQKEKRRRSIKTTFKGSEKQSTKGR